MAEMGRFPSGPVQIWANKSTAWCLPFFCLFCEKKVAYISLNARDGLGLKLKIYYVFNSIICLTNEIDGHVKFL